MTVSADATVPDSLDEAGERLAKYQALCAYWEQREQVLHELNFEQKIARKLTREVAKLRVELRGTHEATEAFIDTFTRLEIEFQTDDDPGWDTLAEHFIFFHREFATAQMNDIVDHLSRLATAVRTLDALIETAETDGRAVELIRRRASLADILKDYNYLVEPKFQTLRLSITDIIKEHESTALAGEALANSLLLDDSVDDSRAQEVAEMQNQMEAIVVFLQEMQSIPFISDRLDLVKCIVRARTIDMRLVALVDALTFDAVLTLGHELPMVAKTPSTLRDVTVRIDRFIDMIEAVPESQRKPEHFQVLFLQHFSLSILLVDAERMLRSRTWSREETTQVIECIRHGRSTQARLTLDVTESVDLPELPANLMAIDNGDASLITTEDFVANVEQMDSTDLVRLREAMSVVSFRIRKWKLYKPLLSENDRQRLEAATEAWKSLLTELFKSQG